MAENQEQEIKTDDLVEQPEQKEQEKQEIPKSEEETSFAKKTVDWIKSVWSGEPSEPATEGKSEDVPDEFTNAARTAGWQDDEIEKFAADYSDAELLELIPHLKQQQAELQEPEKSVVKEPEETVSDEEKNLNALIEKMLPKIQEKIGGNKVLDEAKAVVESFKAEKDIQRFNRVNELMDNFGKQFSELGLTKDLPVFPAGENKGNLIPTSPQFKARRELYSYAVPWLNVGQSVDEAMTNAFYTYQGKYLKQSVERDLIKDLKNHEQKLSGPRTSKEVKKTYESEREEGIDTVRELIRQEGMES